MVIESSPGCSHEQTKHEAFEKNGLPCLIGALIIVSQSLHCQLEIGIDDDLLKVTTNWENVLGKGESLSPQNLGSPHARYAQ